MKKMTKILAALLVAIMLLGTFCGCQNKNNNESQTPVTKVEDTTEEKIIQNGNVRGKVLSNNGDMLVCGIIVVDEKNNSYLETTNEYGGYHLRLQPGKYHLTFTKGFTYTTYSIDVEVESLKTYYIRDTRLSQIYDTVDVGWIPGDLHQHTTYSDGSDSVSQLVISDAAQIGTVVAIAARKPVDKKWSDPIGDTLITYMRKVKNISIKELTERTVKAGNL